MGKKRDRRSLEDPESGGFTMGDMLRAKGMVPPREELPDGPVPQTSPGEDKAQTTASELFVGSDIRLRIERKGRKGKTVTLVEGLALGGRDLDKFIKRLRKAMGVGAKLEGDHLVVQGDIRDRLLPWLENEGATRVRCI